MRLIPAENYLDLSRKAADLIAAQILLKPACVLGLATGSSPLGVYQDLIQRCQAGTLDFSAVRSVNLDEYRGLDADHAQSYHYFMRHNLFDHVNMDPAHIQIPNGTAEDAAAECARYDAVIQAYGGIDLQLLGIGRNAHIGFNEPDTCFVGGTHLVELTQSTIEANTRFFTSEEEVPRQALTLGMRAILQARRVLLIASGADKADALAASCFGPITPQVPASILQLHPDVTVIADRAALSKCPTERL